MHTPSEPLRHEHRRFSNSIEAIHKTANAVDVVSMPQLRDRIDASYAFLVDQFIPHAGVDEKAVIEVERLAQKLQALRERLLYAYFGPGELRALRDTLYDLYAILELHLSTEDEIFLPTLDEGAAPVNNLAGSYT